VARFKVENADVRRWEVERWRRRFMVRYWAWEEDGGEGGRDGEGEGGSGVEMGGVKMIRDCFQDINAVSSKVLLQMLLRVSSVLSS